MPTHDPASPRPPLTFEDILILFVRRFLAPVAASSLVVGGVLFLIAALMMGLPGADYGLLFFIFLVPAAVSAVGLALVGIPAGYLVARLRLGYRQSLWLLVGIGFTAGLILPFILAVGLGGDPEFRISAVFSLAAMVVAAIWTLINADLFRRDNGA
jgi:hypothetical protein